MQGFVVRICKYTDASAESGGQNILHQRLNKIFTLITDHLNFSVIGLFGDNRIFFQSITNACNELIGEIDEIAFGIKRADKI